MKKILVVVDMQNDFIDGSLGTDEARSIVGGVCDKIRRYRSEGAQIIFTKDTHQQNYLETQEGKNLPVEHCIEGTAGWEIQESIKKEIDESKDKIFNKITFGSSDLAEYISKLPDVEEIELAGLCTDICVVSNAILIKAFAPEIKITVDADCCAGVTPDSHREALNTMKMCQINVING